MVNLTGAPKIQFNIIDASDIPSIPSLGIGALLARTRRGEDRKPVLCQNKQDFLRYFGGNDDNTLDALYIQLMLDAGAKLWVARAVHYTDASDPSTIVGTNATFTLTVVADVVTFNAKGVGDGYNGTTVVVRDAVSGAANLVDYVVEVPDITGGDQQIIFDQPNQPTSTQIVELNRQLRHVNLASFTGTIPTGTLILAGGVEDKSLIDVNDYAGDSSAKTGLHALDSVSTAFRFVNLFFDPDVDVQSAAYADNRRDIAFDLGIPLGLSLDAQKDYRDGTGIYTHAAVNSYLSRYTGGELSIPDPRNKAIDLIIPAIVAAFPNKLTKDANGYPWLSAASKPFRRIKTVNNGVTLDWASSGNRDKFDLISENGFNAISNNPIDGAVYYGEDSALTNQSSILARESTSDLLIYITRELPSLLSDIQFLPNDPTSWLQAYHKVRPFIRELADNRGIRPIENKDWIWIGDQSVTDFRNAEFNTLANIDRGQYSVRFIFIPITAIKYISLDIVPTDSVSISDIIVRDDLI